MYDKLVIMLNDDKLVDSLEKVKILKDAYDTMIAKFLKLHKILQPTPTYLIVKVLDSQRKI